MLYVANGARALYFALAPTLLVYGTVNWDLVAVAFATAGLLLVLRSGATWRPASALGLGAATKLYPALLVVPLHRAAIARAAARRRDRARLDGGRAPGSR